MEKLQNRPPEFIANLLQANVEGYSSARGQLQSVIGPALTSHSVPALRAESTSDGLLRRFATQLKIGETIDRLVGGGPVRECVNQLKLIAPELLAVCDFFTAQEAHHGTTIIAMGNLSTYADLDLASHGAFIEQGLQAGIEVMDALHAKMESLGTVANIRKIPAEEGASAV